ERYLLAIFFKNANKYLCDDLHHDLYMKGFLQNLYLRPSCHECKFCRQNRPVDITIADYWGVRLDLPEAYDGKGTSLVVLHSRRGKNVFSQVQARKWKADFIKAVSHNSAMLKSCIPSPRREIFFREFSCGKADIGLLLTRYTRLSVKTRMKKLWGRIKDLLRKIPGVLQLVSFIRKRLD
ncbi:Coenzyme F420 hydrogenase/dehydrogenase, beta subunit C-terminal domain, partial [Selenomonas ruminantium]|uniref:Coenzyme F420 hydrogenase/dehydrogenase, beta subunit C-terminal domain n=1 Tax=Selenomonas ruminantium TaxID=971 RepID=UPI0026EDF132